MAKLGADIVSRLVDMDTDRRGDLVLKKRMEGHIVQHSMIGVFSAYQIRNYFQHLRKIFEAVLQGKLLYL